MDLSVCPLFSVDSRILGSQELYTGLSEMIGELEEAELAAREEEENLEDAPEEFWGEEPSSNTHTHTHSLSQVGVARPFLRILEMRSHKDMHTHADALTYEVMREPVELPSGQVVDRLNIQRHLLNDSRNPFTNQPLTMEDVKPSSV